MITYFKYVPHRQENLNVKNIIKENNYTSIDVGGSVASWSYPECRYIVDITDNMHEDIHTFKIDLQDSTQYIQLYDYIEKNGKFDFSICSHTIEDIQNPHEVILFLQKISKQGYISVPSKYNEFKKLYNNKYRGNCHHHSVFDIIDDTLVRFPKYSWIETDERSNFLGEHDLNTADLIFYWKDNIPFKYFAQDKIYRDCDNILKDYYDLLCKENI